MVITPFLYNQVSTARRRAVPAWRRVRAAQAWMSVRVSSLIQSKVSFRLRRVQGLRAGLASWNALQATCPSRQSRERFGLRRREWGFIPP